MNILLIGGGGREHALARKLLESTQVTRLFVAPGNGGTATLPRTQNVDASVATPEALAAFARDQAVDLTVVGPEAPLTAGVVDCFQAAGLKIFGPTQAAAQLEGSKAFSKAFMLRHGIPTGQAAIFDDFDEAMRHLRQLDVVPVVKASGLAAGKGVIVPETMKSAAEAIASMLLDGRFGAAGKTVILEERLRGPEVSVLAFCDGRSLRVMPPAQDHKRLHDDDFGPNTGGMGAFCPSPLLSEVDLAAIERTILQPTVDGMAAEGLPYVGVLYAGLMLTADGPRVLEFNCRFGDPETQAILPRLASDLVDIFAAAVAGRLEQVQPQWRPEAATAVVMAAPGYPDEYPVGVEITGIDAAEAAGCTVYQAGTKWKDGRLLTAGGRVLAVTALGRTVEHAANQAYKGVDLIKFNNAHYRRDIGRKKPVRKRR